LVSFGPNIGDIFRNYPLMSRFPFCYMAKTDKMIRITVHGSLNDFLRDESTGKSLLTAHFELSPSVKDLIESKGIPHTAIFKIVVNSVPESPDYNVTPGDKVEVYPFEKVASGNFDPIFSSPYAFIADSHLAKLGRNLRLLGLDTLINEDNDDRETISLSNSEKRMILTRDLNLLQHGSTRYGYWVRSEDPNVQLEEILSRFDLKTHLQPFSRCMSCNGTLEATALDEVRDQVPPKVKEWCDQFHRCSNCGKVYWKGSHYEKLKEKVDRLIEKMEK